MPKGQTGKSAATKASTILRNPSSSAKSKTAAGSALAQRKAPAADTSKRAASQASSVLRDGRTSAAAKSAAGSALAQRKKS
jgi:hypothetical protein